VAGIQPHRLEAALWYLSKGRFKESLEILFAKKKPMENDSEFGSPNSEHLYLKAKSFLGIDLTPDDAVPDFVACVAQFQELYKRTFGRYVGSGASLYNTRALRDALRNDKDFTEIKWEDTKPGDVCVFATGEGPVIKHGHVFVVGKKDWMSNNSNNGKWEAHWTRQQVEGYYMTYARFIPYVFRLK